MFDEAFALDAQLILGSMVTPGTAARPPPQRQAAPLEQVPEVRGLSMRWGFCPLGKGLQGPCKAHLPPRSSCSTLRANPLAHALTKELRAVRCNQGEGVKGHVPQHCCRAESQEPYMQVTSEGCSASQKAHEIVEEAAAEAGLIQGDTARLVKVLLGLCFFHLPLWTAYTHTLFK